MPMTREQMIDQAVRLVRDRRLEKSWRKRTRVGAHIHRWWQQYLHTPPYGRIVKPADICGVPWPFAKQIRSEFCRLADAQAHA